MKPEVDEYSDQPISHVDEKVRDTDVQYTDEDMPEPEVKDYRKAEHPNGIVPDDPNIKAYVKFKPSFKEALEQTIGQLGWSREIGSPEVHVSVHQIMEIVNNVGDKYMSNKQVDELINMIAKAPYNVIAGVMDRIRNNESEFFELITPEQLQEIIDNAPVSGSN